MIFSKIFEKDMMFCKLTDEELERNARIAFTNITCFYNRDIAINEIYEMLHIHNQEIAQWLRKDAGESNRRIRLESTHQSPIGYGISKKTKQKYNNLKRSFIILEKSGFYDEGFYIVFTAPLIEC